MTVEAAFDYAQKLVSMESRGPGDIEGAMTRLEHRYGIGFWQLSHLRGRRAKSCDLSLFSRLRAAYLDMCERQVRQLQHTIEIERAAGDDSNADLAADAQALVARIKEKREALR